MPSCDTAQAENSPHPQDFALKTFLESQGYYNIRFLSDGAICNIRFLSDGVVCNYRFLFTDSVLIDVTFTGYERRVCYPRGNGLAEKMCLGMQTLDDGPLPGYTALK